MVGLLLNPLAPSKPNNCANNSGGIASSEDRLGLVIPPPILAICANTSGGMESSEDGLGPARPSSVLPISANTFSRLKSSEGGLDPVIPPPILDICAMTSGGMDPPRNGFICTDEQSTSKEVCDSAASNSSHDLSPLPPHT